MHPFIWSVNWAWSLPLIVVTLVIHVSALALINEKAIHVADCIIARHRPRVAMVVVVAATTFLATCLQGLQALIWASAYWLIGALPDFGSSVLYSLNAMTSYGHADLSLQDHWQLMGALEALNGWLLFGMTTAFLFAVVQKVWQLSGRGNHQ